MNGHQLKAYRKHNDLSLRDVAARLQNVSYTTVSRWEANNETLEDWAVERLFRSTVLPLPLDTLHELLDYAAAHKKDFPSLLVEALRAYLAARRNPDAPPDAGASAILPAATTAAAAAAALADPASGKQSYIVDITPESRVAESPPGPV